MSSGDTYEGDRSMDLISSLVEQMAEAAKRHRVMITITVTPYEETVSFDLEPPDGIGG